MGKTKKNRKAKSIGGSRSEKTSNYSSSEKREKTSSSSEKKGHASSEKREKTSSSSEKKGHASSEKREKTSSSSEKKEPSLSVVHARVKKPTPSVISHRKEPLIQHQPQHPNLHHSVANKTDSTAHPDKKQLVEMIVQQVEDFNQRQNHVKLVILGTTINFFNKKDNTFCSSMTIKSPTEIKGENIYKCGHISGTKVIQIIDEFAKTYGYKSITIEDYANIKGNPKFRENRKNAECKIPLSLFYILAYGQTWYNKHGFKSKHYEEELKHNRHIIQKPFKEYLKINSEKNKSAYTQYQKLYPSIEELFEGRKLFLGENADENVSIKDLFQEVMQQLKGESIDCSDPKVEWLIDIIYFVSNVAQSTVHKFEKMFINPDSIVFLQGTMGSSMITKHYE